MLPRRYYLSSLFDSFMEDSRVMDMKCDVYEKDGTYHIEADVPGFDKKDIQVEYNNGYLKITASKTEESSDEGKNYIKKERSYGQIERQLYIGDIDNSKINAEFKDGTLKIQVPKAESSKKMIEIK